MIPAIAGAEAEVPPTRNTFGCAPPVATQSPGFTQIGYALKLIPEDANNEISGMSRTPSLGTPGAFCQIGLGCPAWHVITPGAEEVDTAQARAPQPPPSVGRNIENARLETTYSPNASFQGCSGSGAINDPSLESFV